MDLADAIKSRRSIRTYKKIEISQDIVDQLIDAARLSPSAGNAQSWAFVIVREQENKLALSKAALNQRSIVEASVVLVVCADENSAEESYGSRGKMLYCLQDTAAATQNILLTACSLGLGTCWIGAFKEDEVRRIIKAPKEMRPVVIIPVGYPNESPRARTRRPIIEIVHQETF